MRLQLAMREGERDIYTATFIQYGRAIAVERGQPRRRKANALVKDVKTEAGLYVADHLWVSDTAEMIALDVQKFDELSFSAIPTSYQRGKFSSIAEIVTDYKLTGILEVKIIGKEDHA